MNSVLPQRAYSDALSPAESCSCQLAGREEEGVAEVQKRGGDPLRMLYKSRHVHSAQCRVLLLSAEKSDGNILHVKFSDTDYRLG